MREIKRAMCQNFVIILLVASLLIVITIHSKALSFQHPVKTLVTSWSEDVPISQLDTYGSDEPTITANGNNVHIIWSDSNGSGYLGSFLWYARSKNYGESREKINLSTRGGQSKLVSSGSYLHAVFKGPSSFGVEVYYKRSIDGGDSWGSDILLSDDDGKMSSLPQIAVNSNNIHVVWCEKEKYGWGEIAYKRSTDKGNTWDDGLGNINAVRRLTNDPADSDLPFIVVNGSTIHVFWSDDRIGGAVKYEAWYKRSDDNGATWTEDKNVTPLDGIKSHVTGVAVDGDRIYAVGRDEKWVGGTPYYSIWFVKSEDNGKSWGSPVKLVDHPTTGYYCEPSSIVVDNETIFVVFSDNRASGTPQGPTDVYIKYSVDKGGNWSADHKIVDFAGGGILRCSNEYLHLVFGTTVNDTPEVFYKRSPDFSPEITYACPETENITINETESITLNIIAWDPDNQPLNYSWYVNSVPIAWNTTNYTFYTNYDSAGIYNVTVTVSDPNNSASHSWNLTVRNVNRAPTIDSYYPAQNITITEFQNQTFWVNESDDDGDNLTYQWYLNEGVLVNETNSSYMFIPEKVFSGNYSVNVSVSDGEYFANHTWVVTVINIGQLQQTINELQAQLNQSIANYIALQAVISQLNDNLSSFWGQLNESLINNTELKITIGSLSQNLRIIWNELNQSLSNNTALQAFINQLNDTLNLSAAQISALWAQLNQSSLNETVLLNQISSLNENITNLQKQIAQLEREKEQAESEREQSTRESWVIIGILLAVVVAAWVSAGLVRKKKQ